MLVGEPDMTSKSRGLFIEAIKEVMKSTKKCADSFTTKEWEDIRKRCPEDVQKVDIDRLRQTGINLRKAGKLGHALQKNEPKIEARKGFFN